MKPLAHSLRKQLEAWTTSYAENLDAAAGYLKGRGIVRDIAERFRLGVTGPNTEGHPEGWLSLPNISASGVVGLKFRCLQQHNCREAGHDKYLGLPGLPGRLWHTRAVVEADDTIHLVEGEIDAITLEQCGLHAVAIPGASMWKTHHHRVFAGFRVVRVWPDRDEAGSGLWKRVSDSLPQAQRVIVRAESNDINEMFAAFGRDSILEALSANEA